MLFSLRRVFFLLLLLLSFSFSLLIRNEREKERRINRGRWWRAHCWFFSVIFFVCACVCACMSMLWKETWFESPLDRSFSFLSSSGKVHLLCYLNNIECEKKYKTPVLSPSFFSFLGDDDNKWRFGAHNASIRLI